MAGAIVARGLGFVVASVTTTGADVALNLGFIPCKAEGINLSALSDSWTWNSGMSSAFALSSATVFGVIATSGGSAGSIAAGAGGITALDGSAGTAIGLNIGTNTIINAAGNVWNIVAHEAH